MLVQVLTIQNFIKICNPLWQKSANFQWNDPYAAAGMVL